MLGVDAGWRLMFFVEGVPAVLLGVLILVLLSSRPRDTTWLTEQQRCALETRIAEEDAREVGLITAIAGVAMSPWFRLPDDPHAVHTTVGIAY